MKFTLYHLVVPVSELCLPVTHTLTCTYVWLRVHAYIDVYMHICTAQVQVADNSIDTCILNILVEMMQCDTRCDKASFLESLNYSVFKLLAEITWKRMSWSRTQHTVGMRSHRLNIVIQISLTSKLRANNIRWYYQQLRHLLFSFT